MSASHDILHESHDLCEPLVIPEPHQPCESQREGAAVSARYFHTTESFLVFLLFSDAPQSLSLTPAIPPTSLVEGDSLTVTCAAACNPTCTFQWSKSGTSTPVSSVSQLSLVVTAQSAATYTCTASNSEGLQTISFNLSVLGKTTRKAEKIFANGLTSVQF